MKELIRLAVFAGMLIGIGGLTYLNVGGVVGATLFAFGLMTVILCQAQLYTGKAGFLPVKQWKRLLVILGGNAVGCALAALMTRYAGDKLFTALDSILAARSSASWHAILVTAIGTGAIMSLAVLGMRKGTYLPLLFGVPVFILCGLPHCVADAFYYAVAIWDGGYEHWMWLSWLMAIIGNYIGCNLPRVMAPEVFKGL